MGLFYFFVFFWLAIFNLVILLLHIVSMVNASICSTLNDENRYALDIAVLILWNKYGIQRSEGHEY
jgi:hypothetical protein